MRLGLERRLEKVASKVEAVFAPKYDPEMAHNELQVALAYRYHMLLIEKGIDPYDPDAEQRLREIEPCTPAATEL